MRFILPALAAFAVAAPALAQEAVTFKAADGVVVHALRYGAGGRRGVVLAFHMAGSNKAEYAPIAPRLVKDGFEVLAVDQRSGGTLWGEPNQTAAGAHGDPDDSGYLTARPDLEAALAFAKGEAPARPVIAVGSSYSASLVFLLAARHPELAAIASFSPGEYFSGVSVKASAAKVTSPVFVTSAPTPGEIAAAKALIDAAPTTLKRRFVPKAGVHGASILRQDRDPTGAATAWAAFEGFLDAAVPPR